MKISYKPLWHLLIEKNMKKLELRDLVGMSNSTLARLGKDELVSLEVLTRIGAALNCRIEDIVEFVKN